MYSRLYFRHTSGSPVTCFKPVVGHRHLLTCYADPALGRNSPDGLGRLRELPPMDSLLCNGRISAVSLYGMRMNLTTCKKKNKKRKKKVWKYVWKRLVFCSCVVLGHFHSVCVFLILFFCFFLTNLHFNDVMKPCRDRWQMYITWIIVVKLRRRGRGSAL